MENYLKLPSRLRRFAELLAQGETAADAVRQIRPRAKWPKQQGYKWRHHPRIAAALKELDADAMTAAGISTARAWREVRRIAEFDHRRLSDKDGNPIPLHKLDSDTAAAIAGIDFEELFAGRGEDRFRVGTLKKYRAWNKVDALKMILQAKKEIVDVPAANQTVYVIQKDEAAEIRKSLDERV